MEHGYMNHNSYLSIFGTPPHYFRPVKKRPKKCINSAKLANISWSPCWKVHRLEKRTTLLVLIWPIIETLSRWDGYNFFWQCYSVIFHPHSPPFHPGWSLPWLRLWWDGGHHLARLSLGKGYQVSFSKSQGLEVAQVSGKSKKDNSIQNLPPPSAKVEEEVVSIVLFKIWNIRIFQLGTAYNIFGFSSAATSDLKDSKTLTAGGVGLLPGLLVGAGVLVGLLCMSAFFYALHTRRRSKENLLYSAIGGALLLSLLSLVSSPCRKGC